jgi:uncharacterized protein
MAEQTQITVRDNAERQRFEGLDESGTVVGFVQYQRSDGELRLVHTEVDEAVEGRGVGSSLARGVLYDVRSGDDRVVVECSFLNSYIDKHPEYAGLSAG